MTQDEIEDEIFLLMLADSRRGAGPVFDLQELAKAHSLEATVSELLAFVSDNNGIYGSKAQTTLKTIRFELSAEGMRHAKNLEKARRKPTLGERFKTIPYGKGVWEVTKLGLAAILGAWAGSHFG